MRKSRGFVVLSALAVAVAMAGVAAPAGAQSSSGSVPGVDNKTIRVGAVVGKTNPTGAPYADVAVGAQAYFDSLNKKGGVDGRKFEMVAVLDDQTRDSKNLLAARSLVEEKDVFAVIMSTQTFASAKYLADKGVPTFGWNIQDDWSTGPNLFGDKGSWLCFGVGCFNLAPVYIAQQEGADAAATLAYGSSPQSSDCSKSLEASFARWGPPPAVSDRSLSFGFSANDISAAVQAMKEKGVDFVGPCMDLNGAVNFQRALIQAGLNDVKWYAPEGYREAVLEDLGDELGNFTFAMSFLPFDQAKYSPEMQRFLKEMKKRKLAPNEHLLVGWQNAMLMHEGIKKAGKGFTQASVVDTINGITDWTANGTRSRIDWTTAHGPTPANSVGCTAFVQVEDGKFKSVYGQPGKPFVCFPENPYAATLTSPKFIGPGEPEPTF
ncbi:MAG: ABC transporter substrate-binding protein [Actinobacteria bacterium]|nr:ABC transporter substrate-binding protein [Actinomycetota bacterium]